MTPTRQPFVFSVRELIRAHRKHGHPIKSGVTTF